MLASLMQRRGVVAALAVLLTGALCLLFEAAAPWLTKWPNEWTLPVTRWIGEGLGGVLETIKPVARAASWLLEFPMGWANALLNGLPWPFVIAVVTALGWYTGGWRLAALALGGLGFVFASGYWSESMNTLALVVVSVPLALTGGLLIGVWAFESPRLRRAIEVVLDVMQTVPTFAYLTPLLLLFGFGPVVGLIASAIYAIPPMARNVLLGLDRVEPEIREAAIMSGATRFQQVVLVEIPAASRQIMVGVNQCMMAGLSMVIIAAVIGGFNDIGWEVLLTMRKAQFGQAFMAGLVIVVFAVVLDRISAGLATPGKRGARAGVWGILGLGLILSALVWMTGAATTGAPLLAPVAERLDQTVGDFTSANGAALDSFKNTFMFYGLLPLRIGLDQAVLPFTWGFVWTAWHSTVFLGTVCVIGAGIALSGRVLAGLVLIILGGMLETGISQLPWPFVLMAAGAMGWAASGWKLARFAVILLALVLLSGLWERALLSLYLSGAAVLACVVIGGGLGLLAAVSTLAWAVLRPVCDILQTIPLFVFLIPVLMFFQIGEFSAFLAIIMYAVVPMIRYTRHGLVNTPHEMLEAATASGATGWQILRDVRAPYAAPTILLGLNQTILYAFAMLVIAALIGTTGLGQSIYLALGQADVGLGIAAGAAMAILALVADRLVQGFAEERRRVLGIA